MRPTIETYFKNKVIDFRVYEVQHKGIIRQIDTAKIVRLIKQLRGIDRTKMGALLHTLEYKGTDIHKFFQQLAVAYIRKQY